MLQWICWWCIFKPVDRRIHLLASSVATPTIRCFWALHQSWELVVQLSIKPMYAWNLSFHALNIDTLLWMLVVAFSINSSWCFVKMSHLSAHLLVMLALCLARLLLPLLESALVLLCGRLCDCSLYLLWAHLGRCSEIVAQLPLKIQMLNCIVRLWSSLYTFLTGQLSLSL